MMKRVFVSSMLAALCIVFAGGCLTRQIPDKHRYMVIASRTEPVRTESDGILLVGRIQVVPGFDRRSFVYRTSETELEDDFYNEFYISPREMLRKNLIDWLDESNLFSTVVDLDSLVSARWVLEAKVEAVLVDVRGAGPAKSVLSVEFTLLDASQAEIEITMAKKYRVEIEAAERSAPAFVDAWGVALGEVLTELENDLAVLVLPGPA